MTVNQLYHTIFAWLCQLWPDERLSRQRNGAWLMVGLCEGRSVQLQRIASKIPGCAKLPSCVRRLARFLDNAQVRVRPFYAPVARRLLDEAVRTTGELRLIADGTHVSWHHQLLLISIAYRRRALPLAWTWVLDSKGHSSAWKQRALLAYVYRLLPRGVPVLLVGDSEFGAVEVQRQLQGWRWHYVLRHKRDVLVRASGRAPWLPFGRLLAQAGERVWWPHARLTARFDYGVNLLADWAPGEPQPWLLSTNLATPGATARAYRRRMWTEELFGDLKGHGFDLESTHLNQFQRLSRLTLWVALLYVWLVLMGARVIRRGERHWVDRTDRRDLCLFQIGWRLLERFLVNGVLLPSAFKPTSILKLSGG